MGDEFECFDLLFLINLSNYNFKKKLKFKFAILFIFFAPNFYKSDFSPNYKNEIKVGIIQPNIDPGKNGLQQSMIDGTI